MRSYRKYAIYSTDVQIAIADQKPALAIDADSWHTEGIRGWIDCAPSFLCGGCGGALRARRGARGAEPPRMILHSAGSARGSAPRMVCTPGECEGRSPLAWSAHL